MNQDNASTQPANEATNNSEETTVTSQPRTFRGCANGFKEAFKGESNHIRPCFCLGVQVTSTFACGSGGGYITYLGVITANAAVTAGSLVFSIPSTIMCGICSVVNIRNQCASYR